jgi:hypothetical protein
MVRTREASLAAYPVKAAKDIDTVSIDGVSYVFTACSLSRVAFHDRSMGDFCYAALAKEEQ